MDTVDRMVKLILLGKIAGLQLSQQEDSFLK
jgi:hypothetical protein